MLPVRDAVAAILRPLAQSQDDQRLRDSKRRFSFRAVHHEGGPAVGSCGGDGQ